MNNEQPLIYLERKGYCESRYFFVSYSHKDKEKVYSILTSLHDEGVNYWYDKDLDPGDVWNEKVASYITDDDCVGAIVFFSINMLLSDACFEELKLMLEKEKESHQKRENFRIIPIVLEPTFNSNNKIYEFTERLILEPDFLNCESKRKVLSRCSVVNTISEDDDRIFWIYKDGQEIEEWDKLVNVFFLDGATEKKFINIRGVPIGKIGSYYMNGGCHYLECGECVQNNDANEKIIWQLIKTTKSSLYFISRYAITFKMKDEIDSYLKELYKNVKADLNDVPFSVMLPSEETINELIIDENFRDIALTIPTNYADYTRTQLLRLFWGEDSIKNKRFLYNSSNIIIKKEINENAINAGIRPIIKIKRENIGG